jgi:hypothetical protein
MLPYEVRRGRGGSFIIAGNSMGRPAVFVGYGYGDRAVAGNLRRRLRDYLFGAGSVVDPLPLSGRPTEIVSLSDREALRSDWQAVGNDMQRALWTVPHGLPAAGMVDEHGRKR